MFKNQGGIMKIGIMSMQRIINYGSYLIAFSLKNIFEKMGHEVEFVDFKIDPPLTNKSIDTYLENLTEEQQMFIAETKKFNYKFKSEFLKELNIDKRNERPELDILVIGSDEVFNCTQDNPDVGYSLELFGKDANAKSIISYAACCGSTTFEKVKYFKKHKEISNLLKKFNAISVRDNNSKEFVQKLTGITPEISLDPVLLYDYSNDIIDNVTEQNYIIVYSYNLRFSKEENDAITKFAKKYNKKIIGIGNYQICCEKYIPAHPLEVLPYFKHADYIFTDTFHGTIFSMKTQRPFATIIRESNKQKLNDLLEKFHLSDRSLHSLNDLEKILLAPIDFSKTFETIEKERVRTLEYFKKNLQ